MLSWQFPYSGNQRQQKIYPSYKYFNMRKGSIVNLRHLPKIGIQDENGKVKFIELSGILISHLSDYQGDLAAHSIFQKYLSSPIQYQIQKGTSHGKIRITGENKSLGEIVIETGVGTFDEDEAKLSHLYSPQELEALKQTKPGSKPVVLNGVSDSTIVKKAQIAKSGTYHLIELNEGLIISKDNYYLSVILKDIELYCSENEAEACHDFVRKHPQIQVKELRFFYSLANKKHVVQIVCDPEFELALIAEGFGKLTLKGATHLPKQIYEKAVQLEEKAKLEYKGLWKNYLDIYSLIYVKNNFLAKVIEVLEGHIYRIQNMVTNKILTVELSTIFCPIGQELGAFEAREFARKQIIGKLVNVYIKKESAYSIEAILVKLEDHESLDKILLSEGWGTLRQDTINQSESIRLKDLGSKAVQNKVGLFSSSKNKVGIIRFEELTVLNTKQTIERARQFAQGLKNSYINQKEHYLAGVIEGFKNNDNFKVRLSSKKAIVNIKIEGVRVLDTKLVVKEYKCFKESSLTYLEEHFLQREVEVRIIEFDEKIESFIGEILINQSNVAETLLAQGLVYIDHSWYIPAGFNQKEEEAKSKEKGMWSPLLLKLKREDSKKQNEEIFLGTISEIKEGNIVFYQSSQSKQKLQNIITPGLKQITTELPKEEMKIGNICAAPFEGELYRAKITSFKKKNANIVEVEYIDYGNRAQVNKTDLLAIPEDLMVIEQLSSSGTLLFLKKLKENNEFYDSMFDEIQAMLLEKQFNIQIVEDEILLFDPTSKAGTDLFHSVNAKILENGFLKLDTKRLYKLDESIRKQLSKIENSARDLKLGSWSAYQSDSEIEDDLQLHISTEKVLVPSSKKNAW